MWNAKDVPQLVNHDAIEYSFVLPKVSRNTIAMVVGMFTAVRAKEDEPFSS